MDGGEQGEEDMAIDRMKGNGTPVSTPRIVCAFLVELIDEVVRQ